MRLRSSRSFLAYNGLNANVSISTGLLKLANTRLTEKPVLLLYGIYRSPIICHLTLQSTKNICYNSWYNLLSNILSITYNLVSMLVYELCGLLPFCFSSFELVRFFVLFVLDSLIRNTCVSPQTVSSSPF